MNIPTLLLGVAPLVAEPKLLVSESANGSVIDIAAGGDLTSAARFATGLSSPRGLCRGPNGDIYVAEFGAGEITIITDGGDFTDAAPFAWVTGVQFSPGGLGCDEERVLVVDPQGFLLDITLGGDILASPQLVAFGLGFAVGVLVEDDALTVSNGDILDVTDGGDFTGLPPFASGGSVFALASFGARRLGGSFAAPVVHDWSAGGDLAMAPPFATLPDLGGNHVDGLLVADDRLYALTGNQVFDITDGGDFITTEPFATGLQGDLVGFEGALYHVCAGAADCDDGDACNGVEACDANACASGTAPDCDDDDQCTADACDPAMGCTHEAVAGCCNTDDDCALDELCDFAAHECVPVQTSASDDGGESSDGEGGSDSDEGAPATTAGDPTDDAGGDEGSSDDGAQGDAAQRDADGGCACATSTAPSHVGAVLVLLLPLARGRGRRRRAWHRGC